jgi:hypothetical protein
VGSSPIYLDFCPKGMRFFAGQGRPAKIRNVSIRSTAAGNFSKAARRI